MIEREKVIAWLADEELYYREHGDTHNSLMACYALALLKEQEAVKPILTPWVENDDGEVVVYKMECGKCGIPFYYEEQKYCSECGTPILWEDW